MKRKITRRKFVKTTLSTAAAVTVLPSMSFSRGSNPYDPKGIPTKDLGKTGVKVPILGYGCGSRFMAEKDNDVALGLLEYGLNNGLYYWDTAAIYANKEISSEERLGRILKSRRDEVFLVTKVGERDADKAKEQIERSLQRLQTDHIDLLHVHSIQSVEDAETLGDKGKVLEVMHDYRDQGIVKHIGFTGHASADGNKRAAELYDFEVMMVALNHYTKGEKLEEEAFPFAIEKGLGVVCMKALRPRDNIEGLSAETLIRYALTYEDFSLVNIGMDSMEVLKENIALVKNYTPLNDQEMKEVQATLTPFFQHKDVEWMHPSYVDGHMA